MLRQSESPGAVVRRAALPVTLLVLAAVLAAPVMAQDEEPVYVDLGVIGIQGLGLLSPSMLHRPIDMLNVRPGGEAAGMGSAWLASASGTMALGWNPAGLATLGGTEISVDGVLRTTSGTATDYPSEFQLPESAPLFFSNYDVDLKGGAQPSFFGIGTPLANLGGVGAVVGFSWRRFMDVEMPEETISELMTAQGVGFPVVFSTERTESGGVDSYAPALAVRAGSVFSFGAAVNILDGTWRATEDTRLTTVGQPFRGEGSAKFRYSGLAPEFGVRVELPRLQLAARYLPRFELEVRDGTYHAASVEVPSQPRVVTDARIADYDLAVPAAMSAGLAFRPFERLLVGADVNSQKWSKGSAEHLQRITGPFSRGGRLPLADVTSIGIGAEYVLKRMSWGEIPVRAGFRTVPLGFRDVSRSDVELVFAPEDTLQTQLLDIDHTGTFHGKEVEANGLTFGASLRSGGYSWDLGIETYTYDYHKWFFDVPFDPLVNPLASLVRVERTITSIRISTTHRF